MTFQNPSQAEIFQYLQQAKRVAIVGLSDKEDRTSNGVARKIQDSGYTIVPVNPFLEGEEILGEKVYAKLEDIPGHIDIVDIFRRSEFLPEIARSFVAIEADIFWAQLGIENEEVASFLEQKGKKKVVMNRCMAQELEKLEKKLKKEEK